MGNLQHYDEVLSQFQKDIGHFSDSVGRRSMSSAGILKRIKQIVRVIYSKDEAADFCEKLKNLMDLYAKGPIVVQKRKKYRDRVFLDEKDVARTRRVLFPLLVSILSLWAALKWNRRVSKVMLSTTTLWIRGAVHNMVRRIES